MSMPAVGSRVRVNWIRDGRDAEVFGRVTEHGTLLLDGHFRIHTYPAWFDASTVEVEVIGSRASSKHAPVPAFTRQGDKK